MEWFGGTIADAVALCKEKNKILVVFVEGKDSNSEKLVRFINDAKIYTKLKSEDFVCIKVQSESQSYMHFASIYQMVPVPSIFFINKSGTPLEIGTALIETVDDLYQKIENVLTGKSKKDTANTNLIAAEQAATGSTSAAAKNPTDAQAYKVTCDGDVCVKTPIDKNTEKAEAGASVDTATPKAEAVATPKGAEPEPQATTSEPTSSDSNAKLADLRKTLEQKRRERHEEEQKREKELELERRRGGKARQHMQQWQHESELKQLQETIHRDRLEEEAARERIRAQIAADRAERAHKFGTEATPSTSAAVAPKQSTPPPVTFQTGTTRLQIRLPTGDHSAQSFERQEPLSVVRAFVKRELLPGTGIQDFILATNYPKREFTTEDELKTLSELGLAPSAVLLVIAKEGTGPSAIIRRQGGVVNMVNNAVWIILSPVFAFFTYIKNLVFGQAANRGGPGPRDAGIQKRANEDAGIQQQQAAKRRNMDAFSGRSVNADDAGTSSNSGNDDNKDQKPYRFYGTSNVHRLADHKDSDDENATWNGNSTQQQ